MISHKTEESSSSAVGHVPVWLIIVSVAALSLVFLSILIACRRQKRNRKQMSDLDVLDTYKQGDLQLPKILSFLQIIWTFEHKRS